MTRMYGPGPASRGLVDLGLGVCINVFGISLELAAPGHHGYQRECDLISGQASTGHRVKSSHRRGDRAPSRLISSRQTSAGKTGGGWGGWGEGTTSFAAHVC